MVPEGPPLELIHQEPGLAWVRSRHTFVTCGLRENTKVCADTTPAPKTRKASFKASVVARSSLRGTVKAHSAF